MIYLDYQASSPLHPLVKEALFDSYERDFANPHAYHHDFSYRSMEKIQTARQQISDALCVSPSTIIFTSGATEANNLLLSGIANHLKASGKSLLISSIEHQSILSCAEHLSQRYGIEVIQVPARKEGIVDLDFLSNHLDPSVGLVSVMSINNETGVAQPLEKIAKLCAEVGALFHTDAAQSLCWQNLNFHKMGVHAASLSAHKCYGPKGIGALYIDAGLRELIEPQMLGGGQQDGLRSGTLPTPLCVGFGLAVKIAAENVNSYHSHTGSLMEQFMSALKSLGIQIEVNGDRQQCIPGAVNMRIPGIPSEVFLVELTDLAFSRGSACSAKGDLPSHVLKAMGRTHSEILESFRLSFGLSTTADEVKIVADKFASVAKSTGIASSFIEQES